MLKVVLDTNTIVSAILSPTGPPRQLVNAAKDQMFVLCSSHVLMAELLDVLTRQKFASRLKTAGLTPMSIVKDIGRITHLVHPTQVPRVIANDADDDHVLACAVTGEADWIVSGDSDVLQLKPAYQGIRIFTAAEALVELHANT
jgi:uncharacterized protein